MAHLGFGQDAAVTGAWHVRASVVGLGIPNFAPCVFNNKLRGCTVRIGHATNFSVIVKAGANGAVRDFFVVNFVAVVAIATIYGFIIVRESKSPAILCDFFAFFPITNEFAI